MPQFFTISLAQTEEVELSPNGCSQQSGTQTRRCAKLTRVSSTDPALQFI
jgi:hypothetical protein